MPDGLFCSILISARSQGPTSRVRLPEESAEFVSKGTWLTDSRLTVQPRPFPGLRHSVRYVPYLIIKSY